MKSIRKNIKQIVKGIADAIYPKTCPFCDRIIKREQDICVECYSKLRYIEEPYCKKCGKQLHKQEVEYCYDCATSIHIYKKGMAVFAYNDMVSKSIYRFKYHNRRYYAKAYGYAMAKRCGEMIKSWQPDVLIPVPIHSKKMQKRGYNQAELIARELSALINIPIDNRCLRRTRHTKAQKELNRNERKKNLEKAFKISSNVVEYKKIVLIDDIYTTGSTIDECAKVLMEAGVKEVFFISLSIGAGI